MQKIEESGRGKDRLPAPLEPEKDLASSSRGPSALPGLLGILAFVFGVWSLSTLKTPPQQSSNGISPDAKPAEKHNDSDDLVTLPTRPPSPKLPKTPASAATTKTPRWKILHDWLMFLATVGAVAAASIYAGISHSMWTEMQKQNKTLREQLETTDRPWVAIDVAITSPLTYESKGINMGLSLFPKNIGHSPAQNVLIVPKLVPVFMGDDVRETQKNICDGAGNSVFRKYVLFPGESYTQPFGLSMSVETVKAHWGKLPPGVGQPDPIPIALVGCVDYTYDPSPRHHQTGFALDVLMKDGRLPLRSLTPLAPNALILRQHPGGGHFAN